jgi:Flp pilus assembly protein TadB
VHRLWSPTVKQAAAYNVLMHIVVIAWLYVTVLMALTETSVVAGILTLVFYGLAPTTLLLWLFGGAGRRRRAARMSREASPASDRTDHEKPEH